MTTSTIIMDKGGSNQLDVHATRVERVNTKQVTLVTPPTSTGNYADGPKDSFLVDLLRVVTRFNIDGWIDNADEDKFVLILEAGGTFTMEYRGDDYTVNIEKSLITDQPSDENNQERQVKYTVVVGENI